jgi:hypothetical protein
MSFVGAPTASSAPAISAMATPEALSDDLSVEHWTTCSTASANTPQARLPAPLATGSKELRPLGGHWSLSCVALAVHLVTAVKLSLRSIPRLLSAVFQFFQGGSAADSEMMTWTTVRTWLMRLGLYTLRRSLERASDWAYLIDHTVQVGTLKCFAVVGIRLSRLPYPERCLQYEDLQVIALVPMAQSNAAAVQQALQRAALRTGVPRLIVSDEGGDVRGGIELYRHDNPETTTTCDVAHKGANILRRFLEADERWSRFVGLLGQTKAKLQQTILAAFTNPSLRPKARFMNLAAPLRWARWCLRALDGVPNKTKPLTNRQRAVVESINRSELEAKIGWLREFREAIEQWSEWHEVIQVVVRAVRRNGVQKETAAKLRVELGLMRLSLRGWDVAEAMLAFVVEQGLGIKDNERLISSTEILESLFGTLKALEQQQSESGLTGLVLALGALVSRWTQEEIDRGLSTTPWKAAQAWVDEHIGGTVQSQRRTLQTAFANP